MPRVTRLVAEGRDRVVVELDGTRWRSLPAEVVVGVALAPGVELDRILVRELRRALRRSEALATGVRALSRRARSVRTVEDRLERGGFTARERRRTLETLQGAGVLDDGRFGADRAEALAAQGWGDEGIRCRLEEEGLAPELVAASIAGLPPEAERARRMTAARGLRPATLRYLAARGFGEDAIEAVSAGAVAPEPDLP